MGDLEQVRTATLRDACGQQLLVHVVLHVTHQQEAAGTVA